MTDRRRIELPLQSVETPQIDLWTRILAATPGIGEFIISTANPSHPYTVVVNRPLRKRSLSTPSSGAFSARRHAHRGETCPPFSTANTEIPTPTDLTDEANSQKTTYSWCTYISAFVFAVPWFLSVFSVYGERVSSMSSIAQASCLILAGALSLCAVSCRVRDLLLVAMAVIGCIAVGVLRA
jgi:hypothetical protein